ncbi:phosphotransferase [Pedobacter cryophilus]|uniref:Aminoglycoside phosphotransferase n=1 Tax=Pedobacter cryophilus TaxID=2571271 RepID=A0A4U1C103_9SPHI|nr:phosphotransferase [Pedobacter cryophilus]TKB97760.1 aminoglycoside phosphotransferase [Pedobacter cryophilus]
MNIFPVSSSILSSTHLIHLLIEKYGMSDKTTCKLLKAGINHSYLLTDGEEKFVFRIYSLNWRSEKEILEEIRLLNDLKSNQISVSYPITDQKQNYIQVLNAPEGKRFGVLFSFAKGEKLLNYSTELHYKMGTMMAQLHQKTHNYKLERVNYTPKILLQDSLKHLADFLPAQSSEMEFMLTTQKYLLDEFKKVNTNEIRFGAVHLDIWFDNFNISKDNEVILFDFDFIGNGWLCMDLAYYILQLHSTERDEKECTLKVASFLSGYESVVKISEEEKRIIPMLGVSLYFFYLGIQCERFENWSNTFLNEMYLKRFINLLVKRYFDLNKLGIN